MLLNLISAGNKMVKALKIISVFLFLITVEVQAQNIYEVEPGTKGNEIAIVLSNSSSEIAEKY